MNENYKSRINKVLVFIQENLEHELTLASLAKIAMYSPFHFHRIFSAVVNEPLYVYISRKRIEKSAAILCADKQKTIASIAFEMGFSTNAAYSKAFKKFYGLSPTQFRAEALAFSKIGKIKRKNGQEQLHFSSYICNIDRHKEWIAARADIEVKEMPMLQIAYVAHVGAFDLIGTAFQKLARWAIPNQLPMLKTITVYYDDPNITDISKVRQAAGIILEEAIATEGEVTVMTIPSGRCVVGKFVLEPTEFEQAWRGIFVWLYEHGYKPSSRDCYQILHNNKPHQPPEKSRVEICIPID